MRGRRFAVRPSRDTWLVIFYVALFLGFALYWYWKYSSHVGGEGELIAYYFAFIGYPAIMFVSLIPVAIITIFNQFIPKKEKISLNITYISTFVILNIWLGYF